MKKIELLVLAITITLLGASCQNDSPEIEYRKLANLETRLYAGGKTTVFLSSSNSFGTPAPNLSSNGLNTHLEGDFQFEAAFVTAPAEINGGIGPIFNNSSCVSCHPKDGRARFPNDINELSGFFLRASMPGNNEVGGPIPVPNFGTQLQNQSIFQVQPEVQFEVTYTPIEEVFTDGTVVTLQKPVYRISESYTAFPSEALLSPRLAPPVFGLGLLEAIPEAQILANVDVMDTDGNGISGKANYVYDPISQSQQLGRFGWKANTATILDQIASAYNHDMGVTNPLHSTETGLGQTNGEDGLGDDPEISEEILQQVTFYCQTLGVPAPRNTDNEAVRYGATLFEEIGCTHCHVPSFTTGTNHLEPVNNQTIYPYTDMLLHDMGEHLADNRPDFLASGVEWKTRPLWGIGLTQVVNGHTHFLHDGRAKNITEAILWHGGEAYNSKENFKNLVQTEREALLAFINSL